MDEKNEVLLVNRIDDSARALAPCVPAARATSTPSAALRGAGRLRLPRARTAASALFAALLLQGCATVPSGPGVMALPGAGVPFERFRIDSGECQLYAQQMIGQSPGQAATTGATDSAVTGTLLGAAAGALLGAAGGNAGTGAAIGAGTGLIVGGAAGADAYGQSAYALQDRYDAAYVQCMYAKGHQVPVPAGYTSQPPPSSSPPSYYPPPNTPPPPNVPPPSGSAPPATSYPPPAGAAPAPQNTQPPPG